MKFMQEKLEILRKVAKKPTYSQRELAFELNISVGKINYILNELKKKGLVKIGNFKKNKNKTNYFYLLTAKGIANKSKLTLKFMKLKLQEYDQLKKEINEK